jgi:periplasmic divalent cation tolerance protein
VKDAIVILSAASSESEAKSIGKILVEEKLAACVNIINGVRSLYIWKEKYCDEQEALLLIKSRQTLFRKVVKRIQELHSYEVPEIIALPVSDGSTEYLEWIGSATRKGIGG